MIRLPAASEDGVVFIFFLPGEIAPGDRSFILTRGEDGLLLSEVGGASCFVLDKEVEAQLRGSREVVMVTSETPPARLGRAFLQWQ